jgi:hypothetical protein
MTASPSLNIPKGEPEDDPLDLSKYRLDHPLPKRPASKSC